MLNGGAISWKSRHQDSVFLSTSEAEFVPASQCGQEVVYLREILRDFAVPQLAPTDVYKDNLACVAMSENPVRRKFSRHIDTARISLGRRPTVSRSIGITNRRALLLVSRRTISCAVRCIHSGS